MGFLTNLFAGEKAKLGGDLSGALDWFGGNWKRIFGYVVLWYVGTAWGPVAAQKAQAVLKIFGL